jgi:hypothetical protein
VPVAGVYFYFFLFRANEMPAPCSKWLFMSKENMTAGGLFANQKRCRSPKK